MPESQKLTASTEKVSQKGLNMNSLVKVWKIFKNRGKSENYYDQTVNKVGRRGKQFLKSIEQCRTLF